MKIEIGKKYKTNDDNVIVIEKLIDQGGSTVFECELLDKRGSLVRLSKEDFIEKIDERVGRTEIETLEYNLKKCIDALKNMENGMFIDNIFYDLVKKTLKEIGEIK